MRSRPGIRFPLNRAIVAIWLLLLTGLSISPDSFKRRLHTTGHFHYLGHVLAFAFTAAVVTSGAATLRSKALRSGCVWALGIAMESAQAMAYHGWFEKRDLLADAAGVATGLLWTCVLHGHTAVSQVRVTKNSAMVFSDPGLSSTQEEE